MRYLLLFSMSFFAASPTFAASIEILKSLKLPERDGSQYWVELSFEETNPGKPVKNMLKPGCDLQIYSDTTVLPKGSYQINRNDVTRPSVWDRRTWRVITSTQTNFEIIIACKSHGRISNRYINNVLAGFARIK